MRVPKIFLKPVAWVVVAFVLRAGFALVLGNGFYQADEAGWHAQALSWSQYFVFGVGGKAAVVTPLPSVLFGTAYFIFGPSKLAARLVQAAVGAAVVWALGKTAETASGSSRVGLIATAIAAVYPFFIYYSGVLMSETLYLFGAVCGLGFCVKSLSERGASLPTAAGAGVFWALAGLSRTEGVPIALFLWLALLGLSVLGRYSPKAFALAVLCWTVPLAGWAVRNHGIVGRYTLDTHGGITFLDGSMNFDLNEQDTLFARQAFRMTDVYRRGMAMSEIDRDDYFRAAAFSWMRANPGQVLRQWIHKAFNFWRFYPRLNKEIPAASSDARAGMKVWILAAVSLMTEPALIFLGFWGAWTLRERFSELFPFYWMILATFGVHVIVISQMRYRLPVMPVLIIFAATRLNSFLPKEQS